MSFGAWLHPHGRSAPRSEPRWPIVPAELLWTVVLILLAMVICASPIRG